MYTHINAKNIPAYIKEVTLPEDLLPAVQRLNNLLLECIAKDGVPIDSGVFNLDTSQVDDNLDLTLFYVRWVGDVNGVITNLNIVLSDLKSLPKRYFLFSGLPNDRFYLLLRTYFYEFYRFREIHNRIIKETARRGIIEKHHVDSYREEFHKAFKDAIELRNRLVHSSPIWTGMPHFNLLLHGMAIKNGYGIKDNETGKMRDVQDALENLCKPVFTILHDEGNRMAELVQALVSWHRQAASSKTTP